MGIDIYDGLYVRQEYWDLHALITEKFDSNRKARRVLVLGSPGIGKSVFGVFLFLKLMTERENIAFHSTGDPHIYYFTWGVENGYETSLAPQTNQSYIGLFDENDAIGGYAYSQFHHSYLLASPHTSNYNNFSKQHCFMVYMNPWTKTECAEFADTIHLEAEEWLPRFNLVGGRPRLLFASPESLRNLLVRVEEYIFSLSLDNLKRQVNLFQTEVFDNRHGFPM